MTLGGWLKKKAAMPRPLRIEHARALYLDDGATGVRSSSGTIKIGRAS
jgi:hypothetical protein